MVKNVGLDKVTIEWKEPLSDGGSPLQQYTIEKCVVSEVGTLTWMKVTDVGTDVRSYCVQKLQPDAEYMFRVTANNAVGSSEPLESDVVKVRVSYGMKKKLNLVF